MRRQIPLAEVLDTLAFQLRAKIYKCMPGNVTAYHPPDGSAASIDVQPAVHDVRFDPVLGARVSEPWQVITGVPVAWPKFGGFSMSGPMQSGDRVLLLGFDLDPSKHRGTGNPEDPPDTARHSGGYWVALPCDITDAGAVGDPGENLVIGLEGGVKLVIGPGFMGLGSASPSDYVALASLVKAELGKIATALASLTVTTGAGTGGTVVAGTPYATPGNVASAVVKSA